MISPQTKYHLLRNEQPVPNVEPPSNLYQYIVFLLIGSAVALVLLYSLQTNSAGDQGMREVLREIRQLEKQINFYKETKAPKTNEPKLLKRPEIADLECDRLFNGDKAYPKKLKRRKLVETPTEQLKMNCDAIKSRILPARNPDESFPVAYAKAVFTDYEFLEEQLAVNYAHENWYCFSLDTKASVLFRRHFVSLSTCLPNVVLIDHEYNTDSAGHYQNNAHFECMRKLRNASWNYIVFQQNHDVTIKSQHEIKTIFAALNGSSDVGIGKCPPGRCTGMESNLGKLGLCPNNLSVNETDTCRKASLKWSKGLVQVSLSKRSADYIVDHINITGLLKVLNAGGYGHDEIITQSLHTTAELNIPGGVFPPRCLSKNYARISRLTTWAGGKCGSGAWRHGLCVYGVEDLPLIAASAQILANKMMPQSDYGAIACVNELLFNRTHRNLTDHPLDMAIYEGLPLVKLRKGLEKDASFADHVDCKAL